MNSDKAAVVRDSVNACPDVVDPEEATGEYSETLENRQHGGVEVTFTGEHLTPDSTFRPAYIKQSGKISIGGGGERPVYVVVLDSLWLESDDARQLSSELTYEIAKHNCSLRFYPPGHRFDSEVWITDISLDSFESDTAERCDSCGSTYFKLNEGVPTCAKCGETVSQSLLEPGNSIET